VTPKTKDKKDKIRFKNRNVKLQLKGRIFMADVTNVVTISKAGEYALPLPVR
jgi:cell division control protein 24